ncbi:phosphoribosyltransferase [Azoarcus sp. KH32C]|uniref:phosphoribosyltransferase n=1 Tax=Azoarcus sp. KH32C TaxID=748247 RepID=UPI0002386027|nr:phosphoribosyltransferase [Azoarcus sp. KH32C]BAL25073.1 putative phosphoribosyltransferase [Azoarcus sp. KH32C]
MKLRTTDISIPYEQLWLNGELAHSPEVRGLVAILRPAGSPFVHSRELQVAHVLQEAGFATLLINLLTSYEESRDPDARFNVPQLANRVLAIGEWCLHQPPLAGLAIGLVASGTASGAAIRAGWKAPERFAAIVCRAGRPDLAGLTPLNALTIPIRMIVGSADPHIGMIRQAYEHLRGAHDWQNVDGVGEQFDETGPLERFAALAAEWLAAKLPMPLPDATVGDDQRPVGGAGASTTATALPGEDADADRL